MEIQTLRIFTGEELKTCLYNQTLQGSNTDVKIGQYSVPTKRLAYTVSLHIDCLIDLLMNFFMTTIQK